MKKTLNLVPRLVACLAAAAIPATPAFAVLDKFEPYVFAGALRDNNLFRSESNEEDETIAHLGVGLKSDLKLSRQHLLLDGVVDRAKYDNFDELDHTRIDGRATWDWQLGNLWSGKLGYRYQRQLSSFTEQFVREKDMRTRNVGFYEIGYQLHPDWRLAAAVDYTDVSYEERKRLDRDVIGSQFSVLYRNTLNTRVGVSVRYANNNLKDSVVNNVTVDNDYDEWTTSGLFYWEGSSKSALEARLGYTQLSYNELDDRDFSGLSSRLTYFWTLTGKTKVDISVWQEPSSLNDEIASYVLSRGVSVTPVWSATPKISLEGQVSYNNDDFKGNNDIRQELGLEKRKDDTWLYRLSANWTPRQFLRVSLSYINEQRDSSVDIRDYNDQRAEARLQFSF